MSRTVFRGARVFDGTGSALREVDVAVEGDRFVDVGQGLTGDVEVDVSGKTLLPGLFNCHVHVVGCWPDMFTRLTKPFSYQFYAALPILSHLLDCGITTVRDCAGADLGVKQAVEDGIVEGPRLQISIEAISQSGGHIDRWTQSGECVSAYYLPHPGRPYPVADGPEALRKLTREIIRAGAEVIKICTTNGGTWPREDFLPPHFSEAELAMILAEANAALLPVMSHAMGPAGVKSAVRAGVRSIEHGTYLDDEAIELMVERGTWLVPTLTRFQGIADNPELRERLDGETLESALEVAEGSARWFKRAFDAGVKVAMGTDMFGGEFLDELVYMEKGSMTPEQVLHATTQSSAELMRLDDELGTIETGKRADLVVVNGDPYDFRALKDNIEAVYQNGVRVRG